MVLNTKGHEISELNLQFLDDFKRIIREADYTNTYKMAWARALVELSYAKHDEERVTIKLMDIAPFFLKYYWNQTIFFNLVQGSNLLETPVIQQITKKLISEYHNTIGNKQPVFYERVVDHFQNLRLSTSFKNSIYKIATILSHDVSWRFCYINGDYLPLYHYSKKEKSIVIKQKYLDLLQMNSSDLFDLINYRWGLILESYNSSPRINKKVKIIDRVEGYKITRSYLNFAKKYLNHDADKDKCFICGNLIGANDISIDHVIPWSFILADDLWNLAFAHKVCNSMKSNRIPTLEQISRLKLRNINLLKALKLTNLPKKPIEELELAINNELVDKFWLSCK